MLRIALPTGSLEKETIELFRNADLEIKRAEREYIARIDDERIERVAFLKPQEIPKYVEYGYFDLGITGYDWIVEREAKVIEIAELNYSKRGVGKVKLVLAGKSNDRAKSAKDVPENSRIATEYKNIAKRYFEKIGKKVKIFYSYGTTEAKIPEMADYIIDIAETGETLRKNNLRIIEVLFESSTKLISNENALRDGKKKEAIEEIKTLLTGVIEARNKVLITMNVEEKKLERVIEILPAMKKPTVSRLYDSSYYAIETVVDKSMVNKLIPELKKRGAEDILEIQITKIVR